MSHAVADTLKRNPMVRANTDNHGAAFTITVDSVSAVPCW